MKIKNGEWFVIIFNVLYILAFLLYYLSIKNYEFLWYIAIILFFFFLILFTIRKTNFDYLVLWGLSLWGFMHMAGGGLIVNGRTLYKFILLPVIQSGEIVVLKFDQFVHFFGFGVVTIVAYYLLSSSLGKNTNWKDIYPLLILIGMGAGVLNELAEFAAVVTFPETGVGGYANTLLDLIFNAIGAIAGVIVIHFRRKHGG